MGSYRTGIWGSWKLKQFVRREDFYQNALLSKRALIPLEVGLSNDIHQIYGSDQSTCSVTGLPASRDDVTRRRRRSLGGRACFVVRFGAETWEEDTYPIQGGNAQCLGALVAGIEVRFADCVELQSLGFGHSCLQTNICEAVKVGLIVEARH